MSEKLDHKPHNSLGAYKIPKKVIGAPANQEVIKDVDMIKKEPMDFEENKDEYYKLDKTLWVKQENDTCHEVNEDLVADDLLEESQEVEEELVKELLEGSEENENKEEDEFAFLDHLMMDLKERGEDAAKEGEEGQEQRNEEELQNNLLLANL